MKKTTAAKRNKTKIFISELTIKPVIRLQNDLPWPVVGKHCSKSCFIVNQFSKYLKIVKNEKIILEEKTGHANYLSPSYSSLVYTDKYCYLYEIKSKSIFWVDVNSPKPRFNKWKKPSLKAINWYGKQLRLAAESKILVFGAEKGFVLYDISDGVSRGKELEINLEQVLDRGAGNNIIDFSATQSKRQKNHQIMFIDEQMVLTSLNFNLPKRWYQVTAMIDLKEIVIKRHMWSESNQLECLHQKVVDQEELGDANEDIGGWNEEWPRALELSDDWKYALVTTLARYYNLRRVIILRIDQRNRKINKCFVLD